jgi:hypothetical protein
MSRDPRRRHDLRLAELLTRDSDRTRGKKFMRDRRDVLAPCMRSPRDAMFAACGRDPRDISFHDSKIDTERRRVEAVLRQTDDTQSSERHSLPLILTTTNSFPGSA